MRKNLILAISLIVLTVTIQGVDASDFHQPDWKSDYQVFDEGTEEEEGVRMPSSGPQTQQNKEVTQENDRNVESWKYEAPKQ